MFRNCYTLDSGASSFVDLRCVQRPEQHRMLFNRVIFAFKLDICAINALELFANFIFGLLMLNKCNPSDNEPNYYYNLIMEFTHDISPNGANASFSCCVSISGLKSPTNM